MEKPAWKAGLLRGYQTFASLLFDPIATANNWRALPYFVRNLCKYATTHHGTFPLSITDLQYTTSARFESAGAAKGHYFHQDLWAARQLYGRGVTSHVDVGSRLDGFIAHVLSFATVTYVDMRKLETPIKGLEFCRGSILALPFASSSVHSLSCLHVIEHIGLGRYGDPVQANGYVQACDELARILAPGGRLLLGTPVGRERLCFDAHRIFDPETILRRFASLHLERFDLIDDRADRVIEGATLDQARACNYGCGLFEFVK